MALNLDLGLSREDDETDGDEELLGWRTRLIERAGVSASGGRAGAPGLHRATTIHQRERGSLSTQAFGTGSSNLHRNQNNTVDFSSTTNFGAYPPSDFSGPNSLAMTSSQSMNNGLGTNWGGGGGIGWIPPVQQVLQQHLVPGADQAGQQGFAAGSGGDAMVDGAGGGGGMGTGGGGDTSTDLLVCFSGTDEVLENKN